MSKIEFSKYQSNKYNIEAKYFKKWPLKKGIRRKQELLWSKQAFDELKKWMMWRIILTKIVIIPAVTIKKCILIYIFSRKDTKKKSVNNKSTIFQIFPRKIVITSCKDKEI